MMRVVSIQSKCALIICGSLEILSFQWKVDLNTTWYDALDESISHLSSMATANYTVLNFILLLLNIFNNDVESYHAVVVIHGVLTGSDSMELISNRIQEVSNSNNKTKSIADVAPM